MIPYDIDPSLHTAEPEPPQLGDGFSPPHHDEPAATKTGSAPADPRVAPVLGPKSPF